MERNFVSSRDTNVAAESEKYEGVEDEGERSRGNHEKVVCGISFYSVLRRDPAPTATGRDSIVWSFLWFDKYKIFDAQFE